MNRIYNLIWSSTKECWIFISERVKGNGKVPKSLLLSFVSLAAMLCAGVPAYPLDPGSLPIGGKITAGSGSIATSGNQMTVDQSSQQLIANWNSFNIGQNAAVRFNQPNVTASALNRITDQSPTQILGSLSSNGQVFLLNPSGIIFGKTAQINVGSLVASSLNMLGADFLAGKYNFSNPGNAGAILNQGVITASNGGVVALIAPKVTNEGSITANNGTALLAAGSQVSLDFQGDGLISYTVDQGAVDALAENSGLIKADGGLVVMTAKAANALRSATVTNTGVIEARTIQNKAGHILLLSDIQKGMTTVAGTLDASSYDGNGGDIAVTGNRVLVKDGAYLSASGATGGGNVLVGGSWQNSDLSVHQAIGTIVEKGAFLEANATDTGNGGTVVAWSDVTNPLSVTRAYGTFQAKGGLNGGDGGRIETSGHWLDVAASQGGASALKGTAGVWLFDPYNVTITGSNTNGTLSLENPAVWTPTSTGSSILNTDIQTKLDAGTSVTVTTTGAGQDAGNITVNSPISTGTAAGNRTLTLTADGSIAVNADIGNTTGSFNLTMNTTSGTISGNGAVSGTGITTFNVGSGTGTYSGIISNTTLVKSGGGTLILSGANIYTGETTINGGTLALSSTGTLGNTLSLLTINGGTLDLQNALTVGSLSMTGSSPSITNTTGSSSLTVSGTGTLSGSITTSGIQTYTGAVTLGSNTTLNAGSGNINFGSTVNGGYSLSTTTTGNTSFAGALGGTNLLTGVTVSTAQLSAGALALGSSGGLSITNSGTGTVSGVISGTGVTLAKAGTGMLTLSGANTYTGGTTVSAGTLTLGNTTALGSGTLTDNSAVNVASGVTAITAQGLAGSGTFSLSNLATTQLAVSLTVGANDSPTVYSGIMSGLGSLTKTGTGTLTLSGTNTYSGSTTISAGTLSVATIGNGGEGGNLGQALSDAANLVLDGGTLQYTGTTATTNRAFTLAAAKTSSIDVSNAATNLTLSGSSASTSGALTKLGPGRLTLSGTNTYSGGTILNAGTLALGLSGAIGSTGTITFSGGTLQFSTSNTTDYSSRFSTAINQAYKLDSNGQDVTLARALMSSGGTLTKDGTGMLTLSGANTYSGGTILNAGTLA